MTSGNRMLPRASSRPYNLFQAQRAEEPAKPRDERFYVSWPRKSEIG
jgi:hypothetical protein